VRRLAQKELALGRRAGDARSSPDAGERAGEVKEQLDIQLEPVAEIE
jgi:hypothetical protein